VPFFVLLATKRATPVGNCNENSRYFMPLTGKQKRYLRGLGHALNPVVFIGQQGVDARNIEAIANALAAHELIKIKLLEGYAGDRHQTGAELAAKTAAELVQVLGKTILLYRASEEKQCINLPD